MHLDSVIRSAGLVMTTRRTHNTCRRNFELPISSPDNPQFDKFKEAARKVGCDEDEGRWEDRPRQVARQKPSEKQP